MAGQGRPILVWLILIFILFGTAVWLFSVMVLSSGTIPLDSGTQAAVDEITTAGYLVGFVQMAVYLTAAIALFMMRKAAVYIFVAALCIDFGVLVWNVLGASRADGDMEMIFGVIGLGITLAICLYALKLSLTERLQ